MAGCRSIKCLEHRVGKRRGVFNCEHIFPFINTHVQICSTLYYQFEIAMSELSGKQRCRELTGRIFCTAVVILAGFTVDVVMVASLMATARTVSPGTTLSIGILEKNSKQTTSNHRVEFNRRRFSSLLYNTSASFPIPERAAARLREGPTVIQREVSMDAPLVPRGEVYTSAYRARFFKEAKLSFGHWVENTSASLTAVHPK